VILYLFVGGYKCRLATFPTRFAHVISILRYCHCFASLKVWCHEQMNKYHCLVECNSWTKFVSAAVWSTQTAHLSAWKLLTGCRFSNAEAVLVSANAPCRLHRRSIGTTHYQLAAEEDRSRC